MLAELGRISLNIPDDTDGARLVRCATVRLGLVRSARNTPLARFLAAVAARLVDTRLVRVMADGTAEAASCIGEEEAGEAAAAELLPVELLPALLCAAAQEGRRPAELVRVRRRLAGC